MHKLHTLPSCLTCLSISIRNAHAGARVSNVVRVVARSTLCHSVLRTNARAVEKGEGRLWCVCVLIPRMSRAWRVCHINPENGNTTAQRTSSNSIALSLQSTRSIALHVSTMRARRPSGATQLRRVSRVHTHRTQNRMPDLWCVAVCVHVI